MSKIGFSGIVFLKEARGPPEPRSAVDWPWTAAPSLPELQPPAAPVSTGAGQGAEEGEWGTGNAVGGSPGTSGGVAAGHHGGAMAVGKIRW
jgi:hypothetical protein